MGFLVCTFIMMVIFMLSYTATSSNTTFDVTEFGAVGDGNTDDTKAFLSAWTAACDGSSESNPTVIVPTGKTFLVTPLKFEGPCKSNPITFQVVGTIIAQPKQDWKKVDVEEWIKFHQIEGLSFFGNEQGVIDGRGDTWWEGHDKDNTSPTALRFSKCEKLNMRGTIHKDSQRNHISISECNNANISNLHIVAPETSPNTDGIDISLSSNVHIQDSIIQTGDDCIAINGGTTDLFVSRVTCGPGHGISVGSLGRDGKHEEVQGIQVDNCTFVKTQNGVRIKTWQGGSGFAKNITFSKINLVGADNPIIINQYYCVHQKCDEQASAVEISDVKYIGVEGTSIRKNSTINFSCSDVVPCTGIVVDDVHITVDGPEDVGTSVCINAHGTSRNEVIPPVDCLQP